MKKSTSFSFNLFLQNCTKNSLSPKFLSSFTQFEILDFLDQYSAIEIPILGCIIENKNLQKEFEKIFFKIL